MSDKIFNIKLRCGCLISQDTGTKENPDGNAGCIPCHYGEGVTNEQEKLCQEAWKEYRSKLKYGKVGDLRI